MALIVHKYGGTSVGSPERIKNVAKRVAKARAEGHDIVVVVSAMSGETNRLVALAHEMQEHPDPRELDVVLATGEQVTIGLLAMALKDIGVDAKSYTGWQVALQTDTSHTKARIENIDDERMRADLADGKVVIVAGFQGISSEGNISTLGPWRFRHLRRCHRRSPQSRRMPNLHRRGRCLHHRPARRTRSAPHGHDHF